MIYIGVNPDIAKLGPLTLSWHGVFGVIGGALATWLIFRLDRSGLNVNKSHLSEVLLWGIIGGLVGSRTVHVIDYWEFYSANPQAILAIYEGGHAIWGAILGGVITVAIYARVKRYPVGNLLDSGAIGLILGQAIGRIGDIINGEHLSAYTSLPWGFIYTHPNSPSYGLPAQHPAVAYEMLWDLAVFSVLWKLKRTLRPPGSLFLLYLSLYAFGRFLLSFLRHDSNFVGLGLNQPQWISLTVLVVAVPWLLIRLRRESSKL
ncbi:MAG: prolipoprotein diacylglyceryl transferase [Dehalococcoidia bacterium]|nr:prolipoprotein diacylglyceryl transferase [Dehalococcoidia bacterium]